MILKKNYFKIKKEILRIIVLFTISLMFLLIFRAPYYIGSADELGYTYLAIRIANWQSPFIVNNYDIPTRYLTPRYFVVNLMNQIIPVYQWGWPIILSIFYKLFKNTGFFIANPLLASMGVVIVYLIGIKYFNKKVALLSSLFLIVNPIYWNFSESLYSEISSCVFVLIGLYFFLKTQKKSLIFNGIISALFLGYSTLIRYTNIIVIFSLFVVFLLNKKINLKIKGKIKLFTIYVFFLILTIILVLVNNKLLFGSPLITGYSLNLGRNFQSSFSIFNIIKNLPFYLLCLLIEMPILSLFIIPSLKSAPVHRKLLWIVTIVTSLFFLLLYSSYPWLVFEIWNFTRFLLPIFPLLILFSTSFILEKMKKNWRKKIVYLVVIASIFIGFIQLGAFKYTAERTALVGLKVKELIEPNSITITYTYDKSIASELYGNKTTIRPFNYSKDKFIPIIKKLLDRNITVYLFIDKGSGGMTEIRTAPKENYEDSWNRRHITSYILEDIKNIYNLEKKQFSIDIRPFYPFFPIQIKETYDLYKIKKAKEK